MTGINGMTRPSADCGHRDSLTEATKPSGGFTRIPLRSLDDCAHGDRQFLAR